MPLLAPTNVAGATGWRITVADHPFPVVATPNWQRDTHGGQTIVTFRCGHCGRLNERKTTIALRREGVRLVGAPCKCNHVNVFPSGVEYLTHRP